MDELISLKAYNKRWQVLFEQEASLLLTALNNRDVIVEHIGSTTTLLTFHQHQGAIIEAQQTL